MKRAQRNKEFLQELRHLVNNLKKMKPNESHILSIDASYGHYELTIGPNAGKAKTARSSHRPIEINGEIHHLFLSPGHIRANPSKDQIKENLKDTVIARGLLVHLRDPMGDGQHLMHDGGGNGLDAREFINLAGNEGEKLIWNARHSDDLSMEAYHLIQKDIIRALKHHRKQSLEYVS